MTPTEIIAVIIVITAIGYIVYSNGKEKIAERKLDVDFKPNPPSIHELYYNKNNAAIAYDKAISELARSCDHLNLMPGILSSSFRCTTIADNEACYTCTKCRLHLHLPKQSSTKKGVNK